MWGENNIYPRIETGFAFTPDMNKKLRKKFNTDTKGNAIIKVK